MKKETDKIYLGIYKNNIYCISADKFLVKHYMEDNRKLTKYEYSIEKRYCESFDLSNHMELYLTPYFGVYITDRDITMIKIFEPELNDVMQTLYNSLVYMASLTGQYKKTKDESKVFIKAAKCLNELYKDPSINKKLNKFSRLNSEIIYSDMRTYHQHLYNFDQFSICDGNKYHPWDVE